MTSAFEATEFAREFQAFLQGVNRLVPERSAPMRDMPVEDVTVPTGPDDELACTQLGTGA